MATPSPALSPDHRATSASLGSGMSKGDLSEQDICTKFITPAVEAAGWDNHAQIRQEVYFTKGRIIVRGKLVTRGKAKRADYVLLKRVRVPLPPLAEQHRIVAKVDTLMALCDELETSIAQATTTRTALLESILQEALQQPE